MTTLKSISVLLCLIGVVVNPVGTKYLPCCCTDQQTAKHDCCHAKSQSVAKKSVESRSCCAKKATPTALQSGCCCVEELPASLPVRVTLTNASAGTPEVEALVWPPVVLATPRDSLTYLRDHFSGRFRASGPSLLALHCLWLK